MSYCPEHGGEMVCRNPDDYDSLIYDCPDGHTIVYTDGAYWESTHPDLRNELPDTCPTCGADAYLAEPLAPAYPWHLWDDDCRAIRTPLDGVVTYCGCGHLDLDHHVSTIWPTDCIRHPCAACECEDFSLVEDSPVHAGMQDFMVARGNQLVAKEYAGEAPHDSPAHTQAVTAEPPVEPQGEAHE